MKNFLYFIVGMIYLPILMVIKVVIYIRDLGMGFIDDYKFWKRVNNNLKRVNNNLKKSES